MFCCNNRPNRVQFGELGDMRLKSKKASHAGHALLLSALLPTARSCCCSSCPLPYLLAGTTTCASSYNNMYIHVVVRTSKAETLFVAPTTARGAALWKGTTQCGTRNRHYIPLLNVTRHERSDSLFFNYLRASERGLLG